MLVMDDELCYITCFTINKSHIYIIYVSRAYIPNLIPLAPLLHVEKFVVVVVVVGGGGV